MIFLRQKHYTNNRPSSRTLHSNRHHRSNRTSRGHHTHPRVPVARPPTVSLNNITNISHLARRNVSSSMTSIDFIRSITVNERLASIGGLFGALSIIITGALLYAIFTAKSQDKWYYIIAVLINISLLILLMISAILFDRCYLKNTPPSRRADSRQSNTRIISINPSFNSNRSNFIPNQNDQANSPNSSLDFLNIRIYNDIPPQYPGYLENDTNTISTSQVENSSSINGSPNGNKQTVNTISSHLISLNSSPNQIQANSMPLPNYCNSNSAASIGVNNFLNTSLENGKQNSPPDYFDLYPNSASVSTNSNSNSKDTIIEIDQIR